MVQPEDELLKNIVQGILSRLPEPFDEPEVKRKYTGDYNQSLNIVLFQEIRLYNQLLLFIHKTSTLVFQASQGSFSIYFIFLIHFFFIGHENYHFVYNAMFLP